MSAPGKDLVFAFLTLDLKCLGCQDEVYLVVNLPIKGMPGSCPRQLVEVDSVGKDEPLTFCKL